MAEGREAKVAEAQRLSEAGLNNREIANHFGVTQSCIWKWLNPEKARASHARTEADPARKKKKRAWERGVCKSCGGVASDVRRHALCATCDRARRRAEAEQRVEVFIELRRCGLLNTEIAAQEGTTRDSVASTFHAAKARGLDVPPSPYFRPPSPKHSEVTG